MMDEYGQEMRDGEIDEDQISTVALLIDDLSSEDPSAKLHSIQRLPTIAQILGAERTSEELVPMLSELIDKIDCNAELMMHLSKELGNLATIMETDEQLKPIIEPLEIMIGSDDQTVREKAVESMRKVGRLLEDNSIRELYLPLLKR